MKDSVAIPLKSRANRTGRFLAFSSPSLRTESRMRRKRLRFTLFHELTDLGLYHWKLN